MIKYRKLYKYKYMLEEDLILFDTNIPFGIYYAHKYFMITPQGSLTIRTGYAWDGATSIPDLDCFMLASLIHDCLYQLIRIGVLKKEVFKKQADLLFKKIVIEDSNWKSESKAAKKAIANFLYVGLLIFGGACC